MFFVFKTYFRFIHLHRVFRKLVSLKVCVKHISIILCRKGTHVRYERFYLVYEDKLPSKALTYRRWKATTMNLQMEKWFPSLLHTVLKLTILYHFCRAFFMSEPKMTLQRKALYSSPIATQLWMSPLWAWLAPETFEFVHTYNFGVLNVIQTPLAKPYYSWWIILKSPIWVKERCV